MTFHPIAPLDPQRVIRDTELVVWNAQLRTANGLLYKVANFIGMAAQLWLPTTSSRYVARE